MNGCFDSTAIDCHVGFAEATKFVLSLLWFSKLYGRFNNTFYCVLMTACNTVSGAMRFIQFLCLLNMKFRLFLATVVISKELLFVWITYLILNQWKLLMIWIVGAVNSLFLWSFCFCKFLICCIGLGDNKQILELGQGVHDYKGSVSCKI